MNLNYKTLTVAAISFILSTGKAFSCDFGEEYFYCSTTNKKEITICATDETVSYSFGKIGKAPEMLLYFPRGSLVVARVSRRDGGETDIVDFPNKNVNYRVYDMHPAPDEYDEHLGGVVVTENNRDVAQIRCNPESVRGNGIFELLQLN